ncbi:MULTISPECIES: hypothetical protein [unclassified Saccharibacter]|uniref:hypothetical protein n=1 Tax=unclassified Saccharibacter TaxID=2648722 RepID=UPI0013237A81|nr:MULTISPECIES: hypothetical protein [unclassified Saccharibacter]MXV36926.1 hypothetical protein [Saccharibacter sp. EH611]MXV58584.1 hypothetical protein [Saccharibacter sp. EH70]MXV66090.1 hypothetical protein [Saccharibacter sp. EH60]
MMRLSAVFPRSFVFSALCMTVFCTAAGAAPAKTDDDDPNVNARGTGVNRLLETLRYSPDSASEACLNALGEMHKMQKQLDDVEGRDNDSDTNLVRDVLASDMEDVITMCGADAHRLCREKADTDDKLSKLCAGLPGDPADDPG